MEEKITLEASHHLGHLKTEQNKTTKKVFNVFASYLSP